MSPSERAFREELVGLLPRLRRFATALSRSADVAEDVLQTALERGLRSAHTYDRGRRLDSWMFKIVQNTWLDKRYDAARHSHASIMEAVNVAVDERGSLEIRDELSKALSAFSVLPEEQRAVLTLVVIEELSYKEAAEALGVPIGTIMSRLARGRASVAAAVRGDSVITHVDGANHE